MRAERIAYARAARLAQEAAEHAAATARAAAAEVWAWAGNRVVRIPAGGGAEVHAVPSERDGNAWDFQPALGGQQSVVTGTTGVDPVEQDHEYDDEYWDGANAKGVGRRRKRGKRGRKKRKGQSESGNGGGGDDESPHWDEGSSLCAASEDLSEPGGSATGWADDRANPAVAVRAGQPPVCDDGSERFAAHSQNGQLGGAVTVADETADGMPARPIDPTQIGEIQGLDAVDDEDVISQLLDDLRVSEGNQLQTQPWDSLNLLSESPQQPNGAAYDISGAVGAHNSKQHIAQAAAPAAASQLQLKAGSETMPTAAVAPPVAARPQPPQQSFVFSVGLPHAAVAAPAPSAGHLQAPAAGDRFLRDDTVPQRLMQHHPEQQGSVPAGPHSLRVELRSDQVPAAGAAAGPAPDAGRALGRGADWRRVAALQADALLLCPITQVGHGCAAFLAF